MCYLYILKSITFSRHYIGISADTEVRLAKHNRGDVRSTKAYRPWEIAYIEEYNDKTDARRRELFLKKNAKARHDLFESIEKMALSSRLV